MGQGCEIRLVRKDEQIIPVLGFDLGGSCWAFGATVVGSQNRISNDPELLNIVWRQRGALVCAGLSSTLAKTKNMSETLPRISRSSAPGYYSQAIASMISVANGSPRSFGPVSCEQAGFFSGFCAGSGWRRWFSVLRVGEHFRRRNREAKAASSAVVSDIAEWPLARRMLRVRKG
jgi:hypothetical protein